MGARTPGGAAPAVPHGSRLDRLATAAEVLLSELQPGQRETIRDVARENNWPIWVPMLGAAARSADLQKLVASGSSGDLSERPRDV